MSDVELPETEPSDYWPPERCWFCGDPAAARHAYRVGLHRGATSRWIVPGLAWRDEWQVKEVEAPRCRRCRGGHHLETLLLLAGLPALAWGMGMLLDTALGNYNALPLTPLTPVRIGVWFLPIIAWLAVRHGWFGLCRRFPQNRRHARRHPAVRRRLDNGWRYGRAPWTNWDKRWF